MDNLKDLKEINDYNDIPVYYCKNCYSLNILSMDEECSYCDDCGSTDVDTTHIENWLKLNKKK